jgi:glycosyltransferase involved in cell wall biosynthesis
MGANLAELEEEDATMKILMVLYYYPPVQEVGTLRNTALVEQFLRLGAEPIIITAKNPDLGDWVQMGKGQGPTGVDVHRANGTPVGKWVDLFGGISNRLHQLVFRRPQRYNWLRENFFFPDLQITYQRAFFQCAKEIIRQQPVDAVFLSCSPFSTALLAPRLKKIFPGIKTIADFRDAWSLNPHISHSAGHLARVARAEVKVLAQTDLFIANTPGMARLYRQAYPELRITAIPNGYDALTPKSQTSDRFILLHSGTFYGRRNPDLLMAALQTVQRPMEFWQIGSAIAPQVDNPLVTIRQVPFVPRQEMMGKMQQAAMLYLKQGFEGEQVAHIAIAAKTFEYLATGIPILADVPEGDNAEVIRTCDKKSFVVTSRRPEDIREALEIAYDRWKSGKVSYAISDTFIKEYSREKLAAKLLAEIGDLTGTAAG